MEFPSPLATLPLATSVPGRSPEDGGRDDELESGDDGGSCRAEEVRESLQEKRIIEIYLKKKK